jgi:Holliday junction resolvase RusA-like endonuclease
MDPKFHKYQERFIQSAKQQYTSDLVDCHIVSVGEFRFGTRRTKDIPNAGKLELDALSGIIYHDDKQITLHIAEKVYDKENPGCTILLYEDAGSRWEDAS